MGLGKGTLRGFVSHLGWSSRQDRDLRGWAWAGNDLARQSGVGARLLSNHGPAPCVGKPLPFSELVSSSGAWDGNNQDARIPGRIK